MRKLLFAVGFVALVVVAAVVAAPWLINASQYRGEIARRVSHATGREVAIDGPVAFVLLPTPRVRASDVRVVSAEGDYPVSIDAKHVELELGWASLFGGEVEVTHLRAIEPRVVIAAPPTGSTPVPQLGPIEAVRIERTEIRNGRIVWSGPQSLTPRTVEQIQATVLASPLASSIRVMGTAVASAVPLEFDAVIGDAPAGRPNPVSVTASIRPGLARATLRGSYDADARSLRGRLQAEGSDLMAALSVAGLPVDDALAGPTSQQFSAGGDVSWTAAGIAANDLVLQLGEVRATGALNATLGRAPAIDLALAVSWLDADKLARLERPAQATPRPAVRSPDGATTRVEGAGPSRQPAAAATLDLALDLGIEAIGLNGGIVRQLRLNAVMSRGDLVINQASALLPGGTEVSGFARIDVDARPARIDGTAAARSDNLRGLLDWLGADTRDVPAGRLRRFESQARIEGTPARIELTGFNLAFDSTKAAGGVTIATGPRIGLGVDLKLDQINIDAYSAPAAREPAQPSGSSLAILDRFDANLILAADTVTVGGETIAGVFLDATLQGGDMVLRGLEIRDFAGAQLEAQGTLTTVSRQSGLDVQVALNTQDGSPLLRLVDLTASTPMPLSLYAKVRGAASGDLALDALDLTYGPTRLKGRAQLARKPSPRLKLELRTEYLPLDSFTPIIADDDAAASVDIVLLAEAIEFGAHEIGKARLEARLDGNALASADLAGTLHDGAFELTLRSEDPGRGKLNGTISLRNADLARALPALIDVTAISGRADFRAAFSAPARRGADLWSGLSGSLELTAKGGEIGGINLSLMRDMLNSGNPPADIVSLLGAGLRGGATPFRALDGSAQVQDGKLVIGALRIATPVGDATGGGGADLGRGTVDFWLALPVGGPGVPPVRLQLGGRVADPRMTLDFAQLQRYLAHRQAQTPGQPQGGGNQ